MAENPGEQEYTGALTLPGETEPRRVAFLLDRDAQAVSLRFEEDAAETVWEGSSVRVAERLKYTEVQFTTVGLPQETVELTWKVNAGHDDTLAGVVIARPNDLRITGEKGFSLVRPA